MLAGDEPLGVQVALDRKSCELRLLQDVRAAVAGTTELLEVFRTIVDQVADAFGYGQDGLYLVDRDQLVLQHQVGFERPITAMPLGRGVIGRAIRSREAQLVRDVTVDPDYVSVLGEISSFLDLAMRHVRLSTVVRSSEERLRLALDAVSMGMWEQDVAAGTIVRSA